MKTLYLLRHAKSSWDDPDLSDHERPLNSRGLKAAPKMGQLIKKNKLLPDLIITSTAKRAEQTTDLVVESSGYKNKIKKTDNLYGTGPKTYLSVAREFAEQVESVMLVGHNPTMEELCELLTRENVTVPTACLMQINLPIESWDELDADIHGELVDIWKPREL